MTPFGRRLVVLSTLSFVLGWLIGCGDVTATMVEPQPPATGPDAGAAEASLEPTATNLPIHDAGAGAPMDAAAAGGDEAATIPDAGAGELAAPEVAPPHFPHCQGASSDYRLTVCRPGCGTCGKMGEASTYVTGCWTTDDFHCVDSCVGCR